MNKELKPVLMVSKPHRKEMKSISRDSHSLDKEERRKRIQAADDVMTMVHV